MAYLKPQTPLKDLNSGDYFYPLTTIDQVQKSDGTRVQDYDLGNVVLEDDIVTPGPGSTAQLGILDAIYPIGSIYMSVNATSPNVLFGGTWEQLPGNYVLKSIDSGAGGQVSNASETGSTTLTAAQSGTPAHSHGLNSHTHSVGAHSHGLNGHTHSIPALSGTAANKSLTGSFWVKWAPEWFHGTGIFSNNQNVNGKAPAMDNGSTGYAGEYYGNTITINATHNHSVTTNASTTGGNSGSTANSAAFNTGAASGSTANNTGTNATEGHTHTAGMPQNIGVYMWKRTA